MLYVNAVMIGMTPHSDWHVIMAGRLRTLLEVAASHLWQEDTSDLLIWSLSVGALAAHRSEHQHYFQRSLRRTLTKKGLPSWANVRERLHGFMWADSACE